MEPETAPEEEEDGDDLPPLHVFFDIEAMQPHEQHIANLIVAETKDDDQPIRFPGEYCTRDFLEWLDTLTLNDTRQVNVLAHNFQGYDGYFVVHQYHSDNRIVEQLRNGCKLLEVKHDRIRFIDSLSFFQMPLSAFPKTFGLTELKKGYFPHKFNIPEHQTYVGIVPALDYYMPETMSPEGKQALEKWHQEQCANNMVFDFQKELVEYCESDVRLLKQGCLTFKRLFEAQVGFNPFDHITIASACNMDLRMNRMIPNSIASEPTLGWKNSINYSNVSNGSLGVSKNSLRTFNMPEMPASIASPAPTSMRMVTATTPRPCTNFKVVSPMAAPPAIQTATKNMPITIIEPCKICTKPRNTRSNS